MEAITVFLMIITACLVVMFVRWTRNRQKRHNLFKRCGIPGPDPAFWTGILKEIKSKPTPNETITAWVKNVFGYFNGELPFVVVKNLEMLKKNISDGHITSQQNAHWIERQTLERSKKPPYPQFLDGEDQVDVPNCYQKSRYHR